MLKLDRNTVHVFYFLISCIRMKESANLICVSFLGTCRVSCRRNALVEANLLSPSIPPSPNPPRIFSGAVVDALTHVETHHWRRPVHRDSCIIFLAKFLLFFECGVQRKVVKFLRLNAGVSSFDNF